MRLKLDKTEYKRGYNEALKLNDISYMEFVLKMYKEEFGGCDSLISESDIEYCIISNNFSMCIILVSYSNMNNQKKVNLIYTMLNKFNLQEIEYITSFMNESNAYYIMVEFKKLRKN